jgi:AhpD family alkylhydroperoxidase
LKEQSKPDLSARDRELVALGAAMGSNCVPCIEYHIPKAREAGLSDSEISEAIRLSDRVRQVPARKVLAVALQMVSASSAGS